MGRSRAAYFRLANTLTTVPKGYIYLYHQHNFPDYLDATHNDCPGLHEGTRDQSILDDGGVLRQLSSQIDPAN